MARTGFEEPEGPPEAQRRWFTTTHWSVVLAAKEGESAAAGEALEKLCRTYWPPIYAFVRRQGHNEPEAQDLTQEFFLRLVEENLLRHLRHQRGKFRSFLVTLLKHFLLDQRAKGATQKRGGGKVFVALDETDEHGRYLREPVDNLSPDQVFERRWAQRIFQVALNRLQKEYQKSGRGAFFDLMKDFQPRETGAPSYVEVGERFGMSEAAVKSAMQRLRQRQREILREEIAHTVTKPEEIDEEIQYLSEVLARARD
jgi:RNA polymerase sigma factor (sigma-70 family)